MSRTLAATAWQWIALGSAVVAAAALVIALVGSSRSPVFIGWGRYVDYLTRKLRRLHVFDQAHRIANAQLVTLFVLGALAALGALRYGYLVAIAVAGAPAVLLERRSRQRVARLDFQADAFCLALANALKSTASVAAAVETAAGLMPPPVSQEIQLAIKETKVGRPLGEALEEAGRRAGSTKLVTVLSAVLIGRELGGNLPRVLDTTAATLREMERLEGVVRQKTADGRMQMWALSIIPFVLCAVMDKMKPDYFEPLTSTAVGYVAIFISASLYVTALVVARKVLAVDI